MKNHLTFLFTLLLTVECYGQFTDMEIHVKDMYGNSRPLKSFIDESEGQTTLFVFWKTCCPTNLTMIDSLIDLKEEGECSGSIKIVLVAVDDVRSSNRVLPVVKAKGWEEDVIMDTNMDLAREMQVHIPPQWVALNHQGMPFYRRKIMEGETDAEFYYNELMIKLKEQ